MKVYLFALLLAVAISFSCHHQYITEWVDGTYSNLGVITTCTCFSSAFVAKKVDALELCRCFYKSEIENCKNDPEKRCKEDDLVGCTEI